MAHHLRVLAFTAVALLALAWGVSAWLHHALASVQIGGSL